MSTPKQKPASEVFNYLTVLTSVVLGLGLSHLLIGYARIIQTPNMLAESWLYTGWLILLLPLYFTYWWAFWDYREQVRWSFVGFSFMLLGPVTLYLITALYLPDNFTDDPSGIRDHYIQIRPWTYGLWIGLQIWGILLAPWLKQGLKWSTFFTRYKIAQFILLLFLLTGYVLNFNWILDGSILVVFWLVLIYILTAHRPSLQD